MPVTRYRHGRVEEVRLYPFVLESSSGPGGGFPHVAPPDRARRILERLRDMSAPYGTVVRIADGVGVVRDNRRGASRIARQ